MVVQEVARAHLPWPMILLVLLLRWTSNVHHHQIQFADLFSGQAAQTVALRLFGFLGHSQDLVKGSKFDFMSDSGFAQDPQLLRKLHFNAQLRHLTW